MASLLDVFNASTRLASQGLDIYSREQKYHLDTELYNQARSLEGIQNRLAQDLTSVDKSGEFPFLNKPEEYKKHVDKTLAEWKAKAVKAGNGSRYYTDQLNRIDLEGKTVMGNKVYAARKLAEREQYAVDVQKNLTAAYNDGDLNRALAIGEEAGAGNLLGPEAGKKLKSGTVNTFWDIAGTFRDNGSYDTKQADRAVADALGEYERVLREEHNIAPEQYIENKARKAGEARQAAVTAVRERNYTNLDIEDKDFRQMIRDYLENAPEAPTYSQIVERFFKGRAEVKAGTEGNRQSEYADDKKPAMKSMFPWDERLGAEPGSGRKKEPSVTDVLNALQRMADNTIRGEYGDASLTTMMASPQARGKAVEMVMQNLRELGYAVGNSPHAFYQEYSGAFDSITEIAVGRVKEFSPAIGFAIEGAAQWLKDGFKPGGMLTEGLDESEQRIVQGYATEVMVNAMLDNVFTVDDEKEVVKRIGDIKNLIAAGKLEALARQGLEPMDEYMGSLLRQYHDPGNVIINDKGQVKINPLISEEWIEAAEEKIRPLIVKYLADTYGATEEQVGGSLSMAEPSVQSDAEGESDVDLPGVYRFGGEKFRVYPKDKTYEIQQYNRETGAWERAPGRSGASRENIRARKNEHDNAVNRNNRQEMANQREANGLAHIMYRGENLPLPNLSGRGADDPTERERAILEYGIDEYLDWLRNNYPDVYAGVPALNNRGDKQ
ncbi:MAG: hypothetical protein LBF63_11335 [Treponema sp.]|jgi:hypothetical protein|nr:hypothetical protein [Treponema sp.]